MPDSTDDHANKTKTKKKKKKKNTKMSRFDKIASQWLSDGQNRQRNSTRK